MFVNISVRTGSSDLFSKVFQSHLHRATIPSACNSVSSSYSVVFQDNQTIPCARVLLMASDLLPFLVAANITDKVVSDVREENAALRREVESHRKFMALLHAGRALITGPGGKAIEDRDAPDPPDATEKIAAAQGNRSPPVLVATLVHENGGPVRARHWHCNFNRGEQIGFEKEELETMECWAHGTLLFKLKDFFETYERDGFIDPDVDDAADEEMTQRRLSVWQEEGGRDGEGITVLNLYEPDMDFSGVRGGWVIQLEIHDPQFRAGNPLINNAPRPGFAQIGSLEMNCVQD